MFDVRHSRLSLLVITGFLVTFLSACGRLSKEGPSSGPGAADHGTAMEQDVRSKVAREPVYPDDSVSLWAPCSRKDAEDLASLADKDPLKALEAASCYAFWARQENPASKSQSLADAKAGRRLAEMAAREFPESGLAHYLIACLTGLEAERNQTKGLMLVPVVEHEALLAAKMNPFIDHGGPDRLLGELYLRAPGFPMSVGDSSKAAAHYKRALEFGPDYPENRLGLVEVLMAEEQNKLACDELNKTIGELLGEDRPNVPSKAVKELLRKLCSRLEE
jgi:hypothetical protein